MLRLMTFQNFIHFRDVQIMEFENGPHLFVGGNSSGKSSALELLRRCIALKEHSSISNSYDDTKLSYAFCDFELPSNGEFGRCSEICSGVIRSRNTWTKFIWLKEKDLPTVSAFAVVYDIDETNVLKLKRSIKVKEEDAENVTNILSYMILNDKKECNHQRCKSLLTYVENGQNDYNDTVHNLLDKLNSTFVSTMPMRSIGPLQWTRSSKFFKKAENYQEACQRAEIITVLHKDRQVNKKKEDRVFKFLTYPYKFEFVFKYENNDENDDNKDENNDIKEIMVKEQNSSFWFPILKTPEGILEAKQFSLIIACSRFHTVCLEEPDRGMHPQMAERMRDSIYSECADKVLIIVSHNPCLMNSTTAKNTRIFFKRNECGKTEHSSRSIEGINRHITDVDDLKKLVFASKVLFVEGKTDKIIIEGLFEHILKKEGMDIEVKHAILSHQIIVAGTNQSKPTFKDFCKPIRLHYDWLNDRNTYVTVEKEEFVSLNTGFGIDSKTKKQFDKQFINKSVKEFLEADEGFPLLAAKLFEKQVFFWKYGDLEDVVRMPLSDDQLKRLLGVTNMTNETKEINKQIKNKIKQISREEITVLIAAIYDSEEIQRFINFLQTCS